MSVPPQLLQQMAQQQGGAPGAAPSIGSTPGATRGVAPAAAPLAQPQKKSGQQTEAMAQVEIAYTMLQQALGKLGMGTPEHKEVQRVLHSLARITAKRDASDLVPAQVMQMVKGMPQMGGGAPIQQALMRQMAMQRLQAMRGGAGGAPGGAPPGAAPPGAQPGAPPAGGAPQLGG